MGIPDGAHTYGSGPGPVVLVLLAVALLRPAVAAAAAGLLHVLIIVAGVTVGVGATSLVGLLAWRWRRLAAARAFPPARAALYPLRKVAQAATPLPASRPVIEHPTEVHRHLHGVTGEDIAAILARETAPGPQ